LSSTKKVDANILWQYKPATINFYVYLADLEGDTNMMNAAVIGVCKKGEGFSDVRMCLTADQLLNIFCSISQMIIERFCLQL
jgi:hypothetical protein